MSFLKSQLYDCFKHWADKGTIWLTSDLHFSEDEKESGLLNKPTDDELIANINKCVGKKDTLVILGDVGNIECVKKLKGYKILVMGNHDVGKTKYLKRYIVTANKGKDVKASFDTEKEAVDFISECKLDNKVVDDFVRNNGLFDEVYEGPLFISEKILLSHEPIVDDTNTCFFNFHGHVHNDKKIKGDSSFNLCCDCTMYAPARLDVLIKTGMFRNITTLHRYTIDNAIARKGSRKGVRD